MFSAEMYPAMQGSPRRWLAVYTLPRHEKQIRHQLEHRSVESFLPLYESVRRWKTGPARVSLPLFPGYLFARVNDLERRRVIELPSVLKIVGNRFGPSPLPDEQIEVLRRAVESGMAEPHRYLNVGSRVQIVRGPLSGAQGVLLRKKGCLKVVLSVETIMQSVAVELNSCDVEPCIGALLAA